MDLTRMRGVEFEDWKHDERSGEVCNEDSKKGKPGMAENKTNSKSVEPIAIADPFAMRSEVECEVETTKKRGGEDGGEECRPWIIRKESWSGGQ